MAYDTEFLKKLGNRIAGIRKAKGMSQEKLAEAVEVHRTYIGFVEQGKRNPSIDKVHRISNSVGLSLSDLLKDL
jgi:transcriptional regulator with XRE-family HTH domain